MSISVSIIPSGNFQSKPHNRLASVRSTIVSAITIPGQPLRPPPNGKYSNCCPLKSMGLSTNLSGKNSSGLCHFEEPAKGGLLQQAKSLVFKTSFAASAEETTIAGTVPK
ncbi:hypothetical protein G4B88_006322 [Cannabis sativa]|uniref:Uncharacterized protein n=1 Tax=Cannabis sativa TaxID=3483 RepID=A0A7J6ICF6_CANSA|nr:hypothetical protein G4B88_006322 [Cannabis sativa]